MFDWREYLDLANSLAGQPGGAASIPFSEATSRCAVSRAYYAAFCHARNYAQQHLGYVAGNVASDHGTLRRHYLRHGMIEVAEALDRLRAQRNRCDYDNQVPSLPGMLTTALQDAAAVIQRL